jgi:threonine synthase
MGLPVEKFIAATNANDAVPEFFKTGKYQPKLSVATLSNAMDVGNPSNWVRIAELFKNDTEALKSLVTGYSYNDQQTLEAIKKVHHDYQYVVCPHTAIAWKALTDWQLANPDSKAAGIFLSTAHPCKFPDVLPPEIAQTIQVPAHVQALQNKPKQATELPDDFRAFKEWMLRNG